MSEYRVTIQWTSSAAPADFANGRYSREHTWQFDGGVTVAGSSSPAVVPKPWSNPAAVDPEEAFVASLSSCHMLTFVYLAMKAGFVVTSYRDDAVGTMTKVAGKTPWMSRVVLAPVITYADKQPTSEELAKLHHDAHHECYISASVKTEVVVAGT